MGIDNHHRTACETCGHRAQHGEVTGCCEIVSRDPVKWCRCKAYAVTATTNTKRKGPRVPPPPEPAAPVVPYAGTSGYSGSVTSEDRARTQDGDGTTGARQAHVMKLAAERGGDGLTVQEVRAVTGWHHGQASSALSTLHKDGHLARLSEQRNRCEVYVLLAHVEGRETRPHGRKRPTLTPDERHALAHLRASQVTWPAEDGRYVNTVLAALERLA